MKDYERFGYHGIVLHIDLARQISWMEEPDEIFWCRFAGGGLLAALLNHHLDWVMEGGYLNEHSAYST